MISTIAFYLYLSITLWLTALTIVRVHYKQHLGFQLLILAMAWTGVITRLMYIWWEAIYIYE